MRAVTNNGFWYHIIKTKPNKTSPEGKKNLYLRGQGFNWITPEDLLAKAKNYIDNHEANLIAKYNKALVS